MRYSGSIAQTGSRFFGNATEYSDYDYIVSCDDIFEVGPIKVSEVIRFTADHFLGVANYTLKYTELVDEDAPVNSIGAIRASSNQNTIDFHLLGFHYIDSAFNVYEVTLGDYTFQFIVYTTDLGYRASLEARDFVKKHLDVLGGTYKIVYGMYERYFRSVYSGNCDYYTFEYVLEKLAKTLPNTVKPVPNDIIINGVKYTVNTKPEDIPF